MKMLCGMLAAVPAAALLMGAGEIRACSQDIEPTWRTNWEQARVEAKQTGKPLFVVFR